MKAFADDNLNVSQWVEFAFDGVENIVGRRKMLVCWLPAFSPTFSKGFYRRFINPLPDNKILDWLELKQIADDILKCIWNEKWVPYSVGNIVKKRRNCLLQAISPFLKLFSTAICLWAKWGIVW